MPVLLAAAGVVHLQRTARPTPPLLRYVAAAGVVHRRPGVGLYLHQ